MKKINCLWIIALALSLGACKKGYLNTTPMNAYSNGVLWQSSNDVLTALNGCYSFWNGNGQNVLNEGYFGAMADCATDNAYDQFPWENWLTLSAGEATPVNTGFTKWNATYNTIQVCNWFLQNVNGATMDSTLKLRTIGEARFIRAYEYFSLCQLYGNVPLVLNTLTTDSANNVSMTSKANVVSFIISELGAIAPNLPTSYSGADLGRITRGAAIGLKARIELFNHMYTNCIADCGSLMQSPFSYSLFPSYVNLFRMANADNQEVLLDVQYKEVDNPFWWLPNVTICSLGGYTSLAPSQSLVDSYETISGDTIHEAGSNYNPLNPYVNRDPRLSATVFYPGAQYSSNLGGYGMYYDPISANPETIDHWGNNNCSPTGYGYRKLTPFITDFDNVSDCGLDIILMRYAEILLTDAEAKIESNRIDASVYQDINQVRERAGMPDVDQSKYNDQSSLRTLVRRERRVELALEGLRWYDIQRWQIGPQVMPGQVGGCLQGSVSQLNGAVTLTAGTQIMAGAPRTFDPTKNYIWPIPQMELDLDKNLVQDFQYQ
jgi:hypothetical protein